MILSLKSLFFFTVFFTFYHTLFSFSWLVFCQLTDLYEGWNFGLPSATEIGVVDCATNFK